MTGAYRNRTDLRDELRDLQDLVGQLESSERLRDRAFQVLVERRERFREIAEMLPEIVFEVDDLGIVTFINERALELTGYTHADVDAGFPAIDVLAPEDRNRAIINMTRVLKGEQIERNAYRVRCKDGSCFPVISTSLPIIRDGRSVGVRGILVSMDAANAGAEPALARLHESVTELVPAWERMHERLAELTVLARLVESGTGDERLAAYRREHDLDGALSEIPALTSGITESLRRTLAALESLETQR